MPTVHYALTNAVKRQWADYWTMRPTATPMDLETVLDQCQQAIDLNAYDFEPADEAELWEHGDIPDHAFIVKDSGVEWVVTRIVPKKRHNARDLMRRKAKEKPFTPPVEHEGPLTFQPLPDGLSGEGECRELMTRFGQTVAWLGRVPRSNPHRGEVVATQLKIAADLQDAKLRRSRERVKEFDLSNIQRNAAEAGDESDCLVTNETGKLLLAPPIRWLLRTVKELQTRVAELESNQRSQP